MLIGFGTALVGVGVGSVTGIMAFGKAGTAKDACPSNECTRAGLDALNACSRPTRRKRAFGLALRMAGRLFASRSMPCHPPKVPLNPMTTASPGRPSSARTSAFSASVPGR